MAFRFRSFAALLSVTLTACGTTISSTPMNSPRMPMRPRSAAEVDMYGAAKPTRPYREVEIIKGQQSSPWSFDKEFEMLDKVREEAGRRGCDGLIVLGQANTNMAVGQSIQTLKGYLATCIQYE